MLAHFHLVGYLLIFSAIGFSVLVEFLRDWLDSRSWVHGLAIITMALGLLPSLLLPLDHESAASANSSMIEEQARLFSTFNALHWAMEALVFVVVPAAIASAGGLRCGTALCASGAGLVVGVALSLLTPGIALWMPSSELSREPWAAALLAGHGVPHALTDGPLALALLLGAAILATQGAAGAVALPSALSPAAGSVSRRRRAGGSRAAGGDGSNASLLAQLRAALVETQEERRSLASSFDLRGRPKGKAQREKQQQLEAREQRLRAQAASIGASSTRWTRTCAHLHRLRKLVDLMLLAVATVLGVSLAASLGQHASRSSCGAACGFLLPPNAAHALDVDAATGAASAAAAAAAVPMSAAFGGGPGFGRGDAVKAAAKAAGTAAVAAASAAATAISLPLDMLLSRAALSPPTDSLLVLLLLMLVVGWMVSSSAAGQGCFGGGGGSGGGAERGSGSIRYRGSSAGGTLMLAVRVLLATTSFAFVLLTLAPRYACAVSESGVPGLGLCAKQLLALVVRLPYFGMAWHTVQWAFAAALLIRITSRVAVGLCHLMRPRPQRHAWDDDDDSGHSDDDDERTPLRGGFGEDDIEEDSFR